MDPIKAVFGLGRSALAIFYIAGPGGIACLHLADLGNLYPGLDIIGRCAVFLAAGNSNLTLGDLLRKLLLTPDLIGKCLTRDRNHDFLSLKQVQDGLECFPRKDRKSTRLHSSHSCAPRMPSS